MNNFNGKNHNGNVRIFSFYIYVEKERLLRPKF